MLLGQHLMFLGTGLISQEGLKEALRQVHSRMMDVQTFTGHHDQYGSTKASCHLLPFFVPLPLASFSKLNRMAARSRSPGPRDSLATQASWQKAATFSHASWEGGCITKFKAVRI